MKQRLLGLPNTERHDVTQNQLFKCHFKYIWLVFYAVRHRVSRILQTIRLDCKMIRSQNKNFESKPEYSNSWYFTTFDGSLQWWIDESFVCNILIIFGDAISICGGMCRGSGWGSHLILDFFSTHEALQQNFYFKAKSQNF